MTNFKSRITNLRHAIKSFSFLCVLFLFSAANAYSQDSASTQSPVLFSSTKTALEQAIRSGSVEQKRAALFQIRNFQIAEASRIAIFALTDDSEIVRATAASSVIFLPIDEASNVLLPLLNDKKEFVRREAAYALGKVRNANAVSPLLIILQNDKIFEVRSASAIALGEIGDTSAVGELIKILQKNPSAKEEFIRRSAAGSIGQIAQIIQTNESEVLKPRDFLPDEYFSNAKPRYPKLIENFPVFRGAINILISTLQNPKEFDDVKREAAFALGAIGDASGIPVLRANLNTNDFYLLKICHEALRKIALAQSMLENRTVK